MPRHVDYVKAFAANLLPVIPAKAQLSPKSTIHPDNIGKVPGVLRADGWGGMHWGNLGVISPDRAKTWDDMGSAVGFRCGPENLFAVDIDLTHEQDAEGVLSVAIAVFGDSVAVRRVDHPHHHKLLVCAHMVGDMPRSFDIVVTQSDGKRGKIQFLGTGRYFNVAGTHPVRQRPYVWNHDPADTPLVKVARQAFDQFWERLGRKFDAVKVADVHSMSEIDRDPEQLSPEELARLVSMIPNDKEFETYDSFIAIGSAVWGASGGEAWGRTIWLDWCAQVEQGDPDKPAQFWDTMHKARIGGEMLRRYAQARQPQAMARQQFVDSPVEGEAIAEVDKDAEEAQAFLNSYVLVGGSEFYDLPPLKPYTPAAFNLMNVRIEKPVRRAFGKRGALSQIFARHSTNIVRDLCRAPGQERFIDAGGYRLLNLWSPPARPWREKPIVETVAASYRDLVSFVLGSTRLAGVWMRWHAFMLQNPHLAPGWHPVVQTDQGVGKDLILRPFAKAHGADFTYVTPSVLTSGFNDWAEKHLVCVSEMKERSSNVDTYTLLKAITSGNPQIIIHRKHRDSYLAPNTTGFVIYSNELHPLRIAHDDRRFFIIANFGVRPRTPDYYARMAALLEEHADMIAESCSRLTLDENDLGFLRGNAPMTEAKSEITIRAWERSYLDMVEELESDSPPPGLLPVGTTTDLIQYFISQQIPNAELPNRLDFPSDLYRLGARPLNPARNNPARADPVLGHRLWRHAHSWRDQQGTEWKIAQVGPTTLTRLYIDRSMPKPDFDVYSGKDEL
jgi:Family of unknown function (DUF5906)/Bifunctional DNA primase/polymerase, N-terminal/Primase C terminal 2 (PriCT-2)